MGKEAEGGPLNKSSALTNQSIIDNTLNNDCSSRRVLECLKTCPCNCVIQVIGSYSNDPFEAFVVSELSLKLVLDIQI